MSWRRMGSSLGVKVREHRLLTLIRSTMSEDTPLLVDAAGARLLGEVHETSFDRGPADIDDQVRLKVGSHAQVIRMTRVRTQAGVPFMIEAVRMPAELLQGIGDAELSRSFLTQWALTGGVELGAAEEVVSAGTTGSMFGVGIGARRARPRVGAGDKHAPRKASPVAKGGVPQRPSPLSGTSQTWFGYCITSCCHRPSLPLMPSNACPTA